MRADVVAIGTELLLGQVVDTNSAWIGEHLALAGIDSYLQLKVGDNPVRIVNAVRQALADADAVICCGGLGPTQDDITREALAEVMGVGLVRDPELVATIEGIFAGQGRSMPSNNLRQADRPVGSLVIPQTIGTAPGLICPLEDGKVIYALPGVPYELYDMMERVVIPDLVARGGVAATIRSRTLRTAGLSESALAERVADRLRALDATGNPTLAFLASGIEGIKLRITARGAGSDPVAAAEELLAAEEAGLRELLGDAVFGVDDDTMEVAISRLLLDAGSTLAVAESLTGGLIASRLTAVAGASDWFRGGVVSYASEVKQDVLGVDPGPVITAAAAERLAIGVARVLGADVGLGITGVAGPAEAEGQPVGTVWVGIALDGQADSIQLAVTAGDRDRVRQRAAMGALDLLRHRLLARSRAGAVQRCAAGADQ